MFRIWPACPTCKEPYWLVKQKLRPDGDYCVCANCGEPAIVVGRTAKQPAWTKRKAVDVPQANAVPSEQRESMPPSALARDADMKPWRR